MTRIYGITAPEKFFADKIEEGRGIFDRPSFEMVMRHVNNRGTVLDVGAHYGTWSVGFAKEQFEKVLAFEPNPHTFSVLEENTMYYNAITRHKFALGEKEKKVALRAGDDNSGQIYVAPNGTEHLSHKMNTIDSLKLDDVDLIKIDVEGYELNVLNGALDTIKRCAPLICLELNGLSARYKTQDCVIIRVMYDMGYVLLDIENKDYLFKHKSKW